VANQNEVTELPRSVSPLDRPGQAAQQLALGDLPGAFRGMFQPAELTPKERDELLQKWGLASGPYAGVFRTLTNPLLIASLALSHKFPVPSAEGLFKLSRKVGSLTSRFPILGKLGSMQGLFRGTKVPDILGKIIFDVNDFRSRHNAAYGVALEKYRQVTGKLPGKREQIMVSSWLDGLHKGVRGYEGKNGLVRIGKGGSQASLPGVGVLMPDLEKKMGAPLLTLAKDIRGTLNDQFTEVFGSLKGRKKILKALRNQRNAGFGDEITDAMEAWIKDPQKIADYFPRRILQSEEDFRKLISLLTKGGSRRFAKNSKFKAERWATPEVYKRRFQMLPDEEDLAVVSDLVDPTQKAKLDAITKARILREAENANVSTTGMRRLSKLSLEDLTSRYSEALQPKDAAKVAETLAGGTNKRYSLKLLPVLSSYSHTLSGTFGWTVKGGGEKMTGILDELKVLGRTNPAARARAEMLENTYIPIAMGRGTFRSSLKAQMWEHSMQQLAAKVDSPAIKKILGPALTKRLADGMSASKGAFSLMNLQRKAAGYFYLSTLGLNPGSALKNTLQLVLTTGPTVGLGSTVGGLERAFRKSHKYFALRMGPRKLGHDAALRSAYPDFAEAGLVAAPITDEVVQNALQNAYEIAALPTGKLAKTSDKIQRAMMSMFTASETTVRLATFEAGMMHANRSGLVGDAAIRFSKKLVEQTQFLTGPQNTPFFLLDKGPLVRQLAQFPLRMLEFATSTAFTLGSGEIDPRTGKPRNILGYNPGTFARMIAGSVIAKELLEFSGVGGGDALLGGALPTFTPLGKVGAPLPIIPPAFQILGAGAAGLASGDFSELLRSSPLMFPGGVEGFKVMGLLPPGVPGSQIGQKAAQFFERTHADYTQPAPDGRIAVYTGQGKLKGYYTPWELVRYGLGVKGGDLQKEQELLQLLISQRDQIRESRVQYMDARFRNNPTEANSVAAGFKQRFGFDLPVSEQDVKAMQTRRTVTRLEQVVRTLPPGEARDQMIELINLELGTSGQSLLGVDPALLGAPKQDREASRANAVSGAVGRAGFSAQTDLAPGGLDQINPQTIGRQQGINQNQPPF